MFSYVYLFKLSKVEPIVSVTFIQMSAETNRIVVSTIFLAISLVCTVLVTRGPEHFPWSRYEDHPLSSSWGLGQVKWCNLLDKSCETASYKLCQVNGSDSKPCDCERSAQTISICFNVLLFVQTGYLFSCFTYFVHSRIALKTSDILKMTLKSAFVASVVLGLAFSIAALDSWRSNCHKLFEEFMAVDKEVLSPGWIVTAGIVLANIVAILGMKDILTL